MDLRALLGRKHIESPRDVIERRLALLEGRRRRLPVSPWILVAVGAGMVALSSVFDDPATEEVEDLGGITAVLAFVAFGLAWYARKKPRRDLPAEERVRFELQQAWMLLRGQELPRPWRRHLPWASTTPDGRVEIWIIDWSPPPRSGLSRRVLGTFAADDTTGAATAMAEAKALAEQSELDAQAEYRLRVLEGQDAAALSRQVATEMAVAERAADHEREQELALVAEETKYRTIEAETLARALTPKAPRG